MMGADTSSSLRIKGDGIFNGMPIDGMTSIVITINSDVKTKLSRGRYTAGMVNGAVPDRKSTEVDVKFDQFTIPTFAMTFMGDYAVLSQGAGSLTDEPIVATLGKYVKLPKRNLLSNSVVVTNSAGTVTYTEGTDYNVNYKMGWILPLRDGLITEAQALKVDADHAAWSGHRISAETQIDIKGELIIDGVNEDDGSETMIVIPLIRLVSKSKIGFLSEDFGTAEMKGTPILKSGSTELYYFDIGS
jgi:hypothetical protein